MYQAPAPKPLAFPVPFPDTPPFLFEIKATRHEAAAILGPPAMTEFDPGLSDCDYWAFEYPCGLQVVYQFWHGFESRPDASMNCGIVLADVPELHHVLRHIPFDKRLCTPIPQQHLEEDLPLLISMFPERRHLFEGLHAYQVCRLDDNGNTFTVGEPTSLRDAKCWTSHFEALGHKQTYWYRPVAAGS